MPAAPVAPAAVEEESENKADLKDTAASVVGAVKTMPVKKLAIIGGAIVLAIIAIILLVSLLRGSSGVTSSDHIAIFTDRDQVIISGNNNRQFTIDGEFWDMQRSLDGSRAAILVDYDRNHGGTLWYVTTSRATLVADDVVEFQLSDTGRGIAFLTDLDRNDAGQLVLFDTSNSRSTNITDEVIYFTISPDGRTVAYAVYLGSNEFRGYVRSGRSSDRIGDNVMPIAVSNGGRHLYYLRVTSHGWNFDASLHVRSGRTQNRLLPEVPWDMNIMLNSDYSEILFTDGDRTFISRNGSDRTVVSRSIIEEILMPTHGQVRFTEDVAVYGVRTFANTVAVTRYSVESINRRFETHNVTRNLGWGLPFVSEDGRTLHFLDNRDRLMRVDPTRENAEAVEVARNVRSFAATADGSRVFFVNEDDNLYHIRGNRNPSRIAVAVSPSLIVSGNRVFYLTDMHHTRGGDLNVSNNGGRGSRVAQDVLRVWSTPTNVFYTNIDGETFRSNGNHRFSMFHQD